MWSSPWGATMLPVPALPSWVDRWPTAKRRRWGEPTEIVDDQKKPDEINWTWFLMILGMMMMIPKYLFWHSKNIGLPVGSTTWTASVGRTLHPGLGSTAQLCCGIWSGIYGRNVASPVYRESWETLRQSRLHHVAPGVSRHNSVFQELAIFVKQSFCHESC